MGMKYKEIAIELAEILDLVFSEPQIIRRKSLKNRVKELLEELNRNRLINKCLGR